MFCFSKAEFDMSIRTFLLKIFLAILMVGLCGIPTGKAQTAREIAVRTFPSVVLLVMEDANRQPVSLGSGFFVRQDVIATNLHVIEGAMRGYAKLVGQKVKYDIIGLAGIDSKRDLALLSVQDSKAPSVKLGESSQVAVGDQIYVIGNPQGLEGTFSQGIVSGIRQINSDNIFQITAPISPGSSGGPILNAQGTVIGIAVATFKGGQNLNFAIPISYLAPLLVNMKPMTPLSPKVREDKSIFSDLGGRGIESVTGADFTWQYAYGNAGYYSFSLHNKSRQAVKNVYCLMIFYDSLNRPIDFDQVKYQGIIPSGLAKRVSSKVDGSVQKLTTTDGKDYIDKGHIECRVLDFQIED